MLPKTGEHCIWFDCTLLERSSDHPSDEFLRSGFWKVSESIGIRIHENRSTSVLWKVHFFIFHFFIPNNYSSCSLVCTALYSTSCALNTYYVAPSSPHCTHNAPPPTTSFTNSNHYYQMSWTAAWVGANGMILNAGLLRWSLISFSPVLVHAG